MHNFIDFNESEVLEGAIEAYEKETNTSLYAGDERRILINAFMYPATIIAAKANYYANQYFAQTAVMPFLKDIGEGRGVYMLAAEKALVPMKFNISAVKDFDITIPSGTRVTLDGNYFFATIQESKISKGTLSVVVTAAATVAGKGHNDFPIGSINTLVDSILYVTSVTNTDKSSGGAEIEDIESYRERILLKPFNYNTAGAEEAYKYLAKSSDNSIGSVSVSTSGSIVTITVLNKDGTLPSELVIARISESLSGKKVRPLTDQVIVQKPTIVNYSINVSYTISEADKSNAQIIQAAVSSAITEFINYQCTDLGKSINPDMLKKYMYNAGAYTVNVTSPSYITVNEQQIAQLSGAPVVTYSGLY